MSELNPFLSFYLILNVLLLAIWLLQRIANKATQLLGWRMSYSFQLQSMRYVFAFIFLAPLLFLSLANVIPVGLNEELQRPAQVVYVALNDFVGGASDIEQSSVPSAYQFNLKDIFYFSLIALIVFLVGRTAYRIVRLYRIIANSYCWKAFGNLQILISSEVAVPFSTRLFLKCQIVVPESLVESPRYFSAVIAHEGQHLRNGDTAWELLFEALTLVFFWNPTIYLWKSNFSQLQEFSCDEVVLNKNKVTRYDYGNCLLHVVEKAKQSRFIPVASSCMAGSSKLIGSSKTQLERRLKMLLEKSEDYISEIKGKCYRAANLVLVGFLGIIIVSCINISDREPETVATEVKLNLGEIMYDVRVIEFAPDENYREGMEWSEVESEYGLSEEEKKGSFDAYFEAMKNYGEVDLISQPRVVTADRASFLIRSGIERDFDKSEAIKIFSDEITVARLKEEIDDEENGRVELIMELEATPLLQFQENSLAPKEVKQNIEWKLVAALPHNSPDEFDKSIINVVNMESNSVTTSLGSIFALVADFGLRGGGLDTKKIVLLMKPTLVIPKPPKPGDVVLDIMLDVKTFNKTGEEDYTDDITRIETKILLSKNEKITFPELIEGLDPVRLDTIEEVEPNPEQDGNQEDHQESFKLPFMVEINPTVIEDEVSINVKLFTEKDGEYVFIEESNQAVKDKTLAKFESLSGENGDYIVHITPEIQ